MVSETLSTDGGGRLAWLPTGSGRRLPAPTVIMVEEDVKSNKAEMEDSDKIKPETESQTISDLESNKALKNLQTDATANAKVEVITNKTEHITIEAAPREAARNEAPNDGHVIVAKSFLLYKSQIRETHGLQS